MTNQTVERAVKPLLSGRGITAGYGKRRVLSDVSVHVAPGEVVGVLGHNGAGKTTLLKTLIRIRPLISGDIEFDGEQVERASSVQMVRRGMSITPAEQPIFRDLTVDQNLELGASGVSDRGEIRRRMEEVFEVFPVLADRRTAIAGRFSGGQQRQLSLGIALMAHPRLMMLDEPSLGISPAVVEATFRTIRELAQERSMSVLVVEQNVKALAAIADRVYVLRNGSIVLEESGAEAQQRQVWWDLF
ncbi:ABC transporter ATP-binding protein [Streptomyces sp. NBC_01314]|uniref:ABC transporter ATP-binding protein n=1 Tax=Streptomyces sp. NBC_01314 TaxID=2903821 RepID=UPI0030866AB8|nr:ABC transporter ATP-binding protein [Streptomyces sp. NBC_01314]